MRMKSPDCPFDHHTHRLVALEDHLDPLGRRLAPQNFSDGIVDHFNLSGIQAPFSSSPSIISWSGHSTMNATKTRWLPLLVREEIFKARLLFLRQRRVGDLHVWKLAAQFFDV